MVGYMSATQVPPKINRWKKNAEQINQINPSSIFERRNVVSVGLIWFSKRTHSRPQQINKIIYSRGVAKFPRIYYTTG